MKFVDHKILNDTYRDLPIQYFQTLRSPDKLSPNLLQREIVEIWIKLITMKIQRFPISQESYDYAWGIANLGEELPYRAIFANAGGATHAYS
jgi:hypothetical protein